MTRIGRFLAALLFILTAAHQATAQISFTDNFNRPDSSSVGNGWLDTTANFGGNLGIVSGTAAPPTNGIDAGIYRPFTFSAPVTIGATLSEANGFGGTSQRYQRWLTVLNDGQLRDGYGLFFEHSDNNYNNSSVSLYDNGTVLQTIPTSFQFGSQINTQFTIQPNGSIAGSVSEGSNVSNFSFGPHAIQSHGNNFSYAAGYGDPRSPVTILPRLNAISLASTPDQLVFYDNFPSNPLTPGHVFVGMIPGNSTSGYYRGFYPYYAGDAFGRGSIHDDSATPWQYRIAYNVNDASYNAAVTLVNHDVQNAPGYNLLNFNCVNWASTIANAAGINLPSTLNHASIADPLAFGQSLQQIGNGNSFNSGIVTFAASQMTIARRSQGSASTIASQDYSYASVEQAGHDDPTALATFLNLPLESVNLGSVNANVSSGLSLNILSEDLSASLTSVNWGDGSGFESQSLSFSHLFGGSGPYAADLLIVDAGAVHSYAFQVGVSAAPGASIAVNPTFFSPGNNPNGDLQPPGLIPTVPEPALTSIELLGFIVLLMLRPLQRETLPA